MKKRLILTNSIIVSLALIILLSVSCVLISKQNYDTYSNQIKDYLTIATKIFDGSNEEETVDIVKKSNSDIRITIIDTNGKVVIDSDATNVEENHLEREELQGSNLGKVFKRYSTTLKRDMLYVASLDNGYYVRIALPVGSVRHVISLYVIVSIVVLILIIIFSIILISYVNKLSLNPINKNMKKLADLTSDKKINDEVSIDDLPSLLNDIHLSLNKKIELINKQKEEMITLINSLNQGLIVINSEGIIKIINKKSLAIFNENLDNVIEKNYVYLFRDLHLQDLIKDVLPTIDNFERAIKMDDDNLEDEVSKFLAGVKMIYCNLIGILEKYGVKAIDGANKPFDPTYHQAVMMEHVDGLEPGCVIEVLQKGYLLKDRVIRPATVKINKLED